MVEALTPNAARGAFFYVFLGFLWVCGCFQLSQKNFVKQIPSHRAIGICFSTRAQINVVVYDCFMCVFHFFVLIICLRV